MLFLPLVFIESCVSAPEGESSSWRISKDEGDFVRKNQNAVPKKKKKPAPPPVQEEKPEPKPEPVKAIPEKKTYSLKFHANGGDGSMGGARHYTEGTILELAKNRFTRPGFNFTGWSTNPDGSGESYKDSGRIVLNKDIELYAQWISIVDSDFVEVEGTSLSGALKGSAIFIRGRTVSIDTFYMCNHEVTQAEYEKYCCYGGRKPGEEDGSGADIPVYYTNWYDAIVYCNLRSIAEGREPVYSLEGEKDPKKWNGIISKTENDTTKYCGPASKNPLWDKIKMNIKATGYRLPTEAEWEYAARGGKTGLSDSYTYSGSENLKNVAWYEANSFGKAQKIRQKAKNKLGIYDMSGNVWEWCWDWYAPISSGTAPTGAAFASSRVERGGDWFNEQLYCTVSYRLEDDQSGRDAGDGFRLVCNFMDGITTLKR